MSWTSVAVMFHLKGSISSNEEHWIIKQRRVCVCLKHLTERTKTSFSDVHTDLDYKENICRTRTSGRTEVRLKYVTSAVSGAFLGGDKRRSGAERSAILTSTGSENLELRWDRAPRWSRKTTRRTSARNEWRKKKTSQGVLVLQGWIYRDYFAAFYHDSI